MPLDNLTGTITTFKRDETKRKYLRDYTTRNPGAGTGPGTLPDIDASVMADTLSPLYANAVTIGNNVASATKTGQALIDEAARWGTSPLPPVGASGAVTISASVGGTHLFVGDEIKVNGFRYQCTAEAVYLDQSAVPIAAVLDTGPATNVTAGTVMAWSSPRPGCSKLATVVAQSDGTGLTGGRFVEDDAALNTRLISLRANPPASGNDADYQAAIAKTPGVSIQQSFTYNANKGSGSISFCFTLRPAQPGGARIPSATQIALVNAWLNSRFPAGDEIFACTLTASPVAIALKISWAHGQPGWVDAVPWPNYAATMVAVKAATVPTATTFKLTNIVTAPAAGMTIGFYDTVAGRFRKKRILTATLNAGDYDIVVDTTNAASDVGYTPVVGQPCCPWSDSLDSLTLPVVSYFDILGPGEQTSNLYDPGLRERRSPPNPASWQSSITNRILTGLFALPQTQDVVLLAPATPTDVHVGTVGVTSWLFTLQTLVAFAQ